MNPGSNPQDIENENNDSGQSSPEIIMYKPSLYIPEPELIVSEMPDDADTEEVTDDKISSLTKKIGKMQVVLARLEQKKAEFVELRKKRFDRKKRRAQALYNRKWQLYDEYQKNFKAERETESTNLMKTYQIGARNIIDVVKVVTDDAIPENVGEVLYRLKLITERHNVQQDEFNKLKDEWRALTDACKEFGIDFLPPTDDDLRSKVKNIMDNDEIAMWEPKDQVSEIIKLAAKLRAERRHEEISQEKMVYQEDR
jgi:hypothetical protein